MKINSRTKGRSGEQEVATMLRAIPGMPKIERNQMQTAVGGADILSVPSLAIEVKRCETLQLDNWWAQAVDQAKREKRLPVLIYRQSRHPWRVRMFLKVGERRVQVEISWEDFALWLEDRLS
jgi:hypothetical protein